VGAISDVFCLLDRLAAEGAFAGVGSGSGVGSRAGAFRFRDEGGGRVDEAAAGSAAFAEEPGGESEALAACLADDRVVLEDMSVNSRRLSDAVNSSQLFPNYAGLIENLHRRCNRKQ